MTEPPSTVEIKSGAFWRLLPKGMRRRWWLFRPFDWLARHLPLPIKRRGLVVIRMDGIGDMVLFRNSLDHYADAFDVDPTEITVIGCESWQPIAHEVFAGYKVMAINEHRYARHLLYRFTVNLKIRRLAPAITVTDAYFRRALMADSLAWVANAPRTVVALPYINEPTRVEYTWYMSQGWEVIDTGPYPRHEIVRHAAFVSAIAGREIVPQAPHIQWPARLAALDRPQPFAVLNPGSNEFGRRWPLDEYVALARWLRGRGLQVVFVGKADEKADGNTDGSAIDELAGDDGVLDMTGKSTLPQLLDLMRDAELVVSNDTGPAHVGIALGTSTVVIVGGGHFGSFVPYPDGVAPDHARFVHERMDCYHCFWRCHKRTDPQDSFPCVTAVSMDKVQAACSELLGSSAPP